MAASDILAKVKAKLAKASAKVGDGSSLVYLNQKSRGAGDPTSPPTENVTPILLVDAIVKTYNLKLIDNDLIRGGDIQLISNGEVAINQNDEIDVNGKIYAVIAVEVKSPANVPFAYLSQLRAQ
jgi:hypothetical protein